MKERRFVEYNLPDKAEAEDDPDKITAHKRIHVFLFKPESEFCEVVVIKTVIRISAFAELLLRENAAAEYEELQVKEDNDDKNNLPAQKEWRCEEGNDDGEVQPKDQAEIAMFLAHEPTPS